MKKKDEEIVSQEETEVKDLVKRFIAAGTYPIIRWYGIRPKVLTLVRTSIVDTTVVLTWTSVPGATSYRVYHGRSSNGDFTLGTTVTVTSATLTGLTNNVALYFYVVPMFDDNPGLKSDVVLCLTGVDPLSITATADAVLVNGWVELTATADAVITA